MRLSSVDSSTGLEVRVAVDQGDLVAGQRVRWVFTVVNHGTTGRPLTFASAQRGDVVLSAAGSQQYCWSRGRLFAAAIEQRELDPGEEWSFSLEDTLELNAGRYALHARVTALPALPLVLGVVDVHQR